MSTKTFHIMYTIHFMINIIIENTGSIFILAVTWEITALKYHIDYEVNTTCTLIYTPPHKAPLYSTIDKSFKCLLENLLKIPPIKVGHILLIHHHSMVILNHHGYVKP